MASGNTTALLDSLNEKIGLWTALAALAAAAAASVGVWANMMTSRAMKRADAKERPWLSPSHSVAENRQGGFRLAFDIRNYGATMAHSHRMHIWRCEGSDYKVLHSTSSFNPIVPGQEVQLRTIVENYTPQERAFLTVRLAYADPHGTKHETWLVYNWPMAPVTGAFEPTLVAADHEPSESLKKDLAQRFP